MQTTASARVFQWQASTGLALLGTALLALQFFARSDVMSSPSMATMMMAAGYMALSTSLMLNLGAATSLAVRQQWRCIPQHLMEFTLTVLLLRAVVLP